MTTTTPARHDLRPLFEPKSIALIGATDKSMWSLNTFLNIQGSDFTGRTYLVNPRTPEVHGEKTYQSIAELPEVVDLVFVMVPTGAVLGTLKEAVAAGTRATTCAHFSSPSPSRSSVQPTSRCGRSTHS